MEIGEHFERFVLEQILKNFDLTSEEIDFGWTDGSLDGGIDGFYVFINGRLLTDPTDFPWPRSGAEIHVYLITCKHHATFQQAPLDALLASVQDLFDLSKTSVSVAGKYSADIKRCREIFASAFKHLSLYRPVLTFSIVYASRGDTELLGGSILARARQLTELFNSYFSASSAVFTALGAAELVHLHRQVKSFALDLPVQECLTAGQEGYVVLTKLKDYSLFVQDDKKELRRYLFDSNVRAYLGKNLVNADISETLNSFSAPNFWWLNNGVTILATSASLVGKTLKLRDIQIVNGLQTTESIYRYYLNVEVSKNDERTLLVKIIVSQEESVRDQVIRATNNQSAVEPAALHATDKIQRSIEEILLQHEWFYERRTNFYKNEGRPDSRIISPIIMAAGSVALLLKNPVKSSKLRQKHLREPENYEAVYSERFPINAWPIVAALVRGAENAITRSHKANKFAHWQFASSWRGVIAYITVARILGTYSFNHQDLISIDLKQTTDMFFIECWEEIIRVGSPISSKKVTEKQMKRIADAAALTWSIQGIFSEGLRQFPTELAELQAKEKKLSDDVDFLKLVDDSLPPQPWKIGVHVQVAQTSQHRVKKAIQSLISKGVRYQQRDGIVYDKEGREVMRDASR